MRKTRRKVLPVLALLVVFALIAAACGDDSSESTTTAAGTTEATTTTAGTTATTGASALPCATDTDNVLAGELAYYTGEFAPYGKMLTGSLTFPIDYVINLDPPLGRHWDFVAEDIGTVGEAAAAHKLIEEEGADILISPAHGYGPYRSWFIEWEAEHDSPLAPTVHGGSIPFDIGGDVEEPIFRAQGPDAGLGAEATIYADMIGAKTIVIFATQVEGFQLASDAAEAAIPVVGNGLELLARIDAPAVQDSYRTQAQQIADLNPDAVIMEAGSLESATLIKEVAEAGLSTNWIGEPGHSQPEFLETLGLDTLATQKSIGYITSGYQENAAWDEYKAVFEASPYAQDADYLGPDNLYNFTAYDILVITALAVEQGGSYCTSDWVPAMFSVTSAPGTQCYTYADCLALIRQGEEIDYEGVTGPGDFVPGGMNVITPVFQLINPPNGDLTTIYLDPLSTLQIVNEVSVPGGDSWAG
jgi:ABC-type branched-subunit amino acid transport system substrate-binding protein